MILVHVPIVFKKRDFSGIMVWKILKWSYIFYRSQELNLF